MYKIKKTSREIFIYLFIYLENLLCIFKKMHAIIIPLTDNLSSWSVNRVLDHLNILLNSVNWIDFGQLKSNASRYCNLVTDLVKTKGFWIAECKIQFFNRVLVKRIIYPLILRIILIKTFANEKGHNLLSLHFETN